jgi:uncharacterized membrane protein (DUF106 family)
LNAIWGALTQFFTLILKPFENGHAYAGMLFISLVTGAVMLLLFKATSNQRGMKDIKTKIGAYFLEMRLYKDDVSAVMASQRRVLRANLGYMRLAVLPALVMIVPVVLIMVQLSLRYAYQGLVPGETAMVTVKVVEGVDAVGAGLTLSTGDGVEKVSPAVRIRDLGEVDWKLKLTTPGVHEIRLSSASGEMTLPVFGAGRLRPLYTVFKRASFLEGFLNPGSPVVPASIPVESVEIKYQPMAFSFGLFRLSWLWTFLIVSMAVGGLLKFVFGVE